LKFRVRRTTGAKRRATGEIDIVAEFFARKITGTSRFRHQGIEKKYIYSFKIKNNNINNIIYKIRKKHSIFLKFMLL